MKTFVVMYSVDGTFVTREVEADYFEPCPPGVIFYVQGDVRRDGFAIGYYPEVYEVLAGTLAEKS